MTHFGEIFETTFKNIFHLSYPFIKIPCLFPSSMTFLPAWPALHETPKTANRLSYSHKPHSLLPACLPPSLVSITSSHLSSPKLKLGGASHKNFTIYSASPHPQPPSHLHTLGFALLYLLPFLPPTFRMRTGTGLGHFLPSLLSVLYFLCAFFFFSCLPLLSACTHTPVCLPMLLPSPNKNK